MDRRELIKLGAGTLASTLGSTDALVPPEPGHVQQIEKWGLFEADVKGPSTGNPFVDVSFGATFTLGHRSLDVQGFYDGGGSYKVRFSPDTTGRWTFTTSSNVKALAGSMGAFECVAAGAGNRGPVGTAHQFHFQYADGTPYFPFGTTCYGYGTGDPALARTALEAMRDAGFNKVRFHLLTKAAPRKPLPALPFEQGGPALHAAPPAGAESDLASFDLTRPNPVFFRAVEGRIHDLLTAGIEADVILFNPYDAKGFSAMGQEADDRYLRYAVARLSAYRNVWWSIANEYDLVKSKSVTDWDRFFRIVQECDPHSRLRSIHHSRVVYDHSKPWCTHASLQEYDFEKSAERFAAWNKPIVYDEIQYEGDIERRWGNLSPEEMTHRFWRAVVNGAYATHGETYMSAQGEPVWTDCGKLQGTSAPRITFLRKLLESSGTVGLVAAQAPYYANAYNTDKTYLYYFDYHRVGEYEFPLPEKVSFRAAMIDPWAMTQTPLPGTFTGKSKIRLTGKAYMAVLFTRA